MKNTKLLIILTLLFFSSCLDPAFPPIEFADSIVRLDEVRVDISDVYVRASYQLQHLDDQRLSETTIKIGFVWSEEPSPMVDIDGKCTQGGCHVDTVLAKREGSFDWMPIPINAGTEYYIRAFLIVEGMPMYSEETSFGVVWEQLEQPSDLYQRFDATSFSIRDTSYIISGLDEDGLPISNYLVFTTSGGESWTKYSLPTGFSARNNATAFAFKEMAIVGFGKDHLGRNLTDSWLFTSTLAPAVLLESTIEKRQGAVGFSINSKGYLGTGNDLGLFYDSLAVFDPMTRLWDVHSRLPLPEDFERRTEAVALTVGNTAYIGFGKSQDGRFLNDWWSYDGSDFTKLASNTPLEARAKAVCYVLNDRAYVGLGRSATGLLDDIWEFNPQNKDWNKVSELPKTASKRSAPVFFTLGNKGYLYSGLAEDHTVLTDFWKFTPLQTK